jgi:hypothetical protein
MSTKAQQILNPQSDWNQADNNEPIFVLRAINWKAALIIAVLNKDPNRTAEQLIAAALEMKEFLNETDIPF